MRSSRLSRVFLLPALLAAGSIVCAARAADPPPAGPAPAGQTPPGGYVTREEYDKLKSGYDEMRQELNEIKQERAAEKAAATAAAANAAKSSTTTSAPAGGGGAGAGENQAVTQEDLQEIRDNYKRVMEDIEHYKPGQSTVAIHGDASVGFSTQRKENSTFFAGVSPLILFQPTDYILIETAFDLSTSTDPDANSSTSIDLTIANISFLLNDALAVGAGEFIVPFGVYHNHFDPPWINKFPDDPLPFGDNPIAPNSEVGVFARGAIPISSTKLTYDVYASNGPNLIVNDPNAAGSLNFDNFTDLNNNKAFGGRIGFLPAPNIEFGYSIESSKVNPNKFEDVHALLQAVDFNWRQDVPALAGLFDTRAEWVWSNTDQATYDPDGSMGFGPIRFSGYRTGGYVQLCYRPTHADYKLLRDFELVSRYDMLRTPTSAPGGNTEQRATVGLDYWVTPAIVIKGAYEFDFKKVGPSQNSLLFQVGIGL
jgi:hypothetical protein